MKMIIEINLYMCKGERVMSVVIVGGNDCMVCQYKTICKKYSYKAKVFTQVPSDFKSKIGSPDLVVLFTSTVSHSMVRCALKEAQRKNVEVVRSHTSSSNALKCILEARNNGNEYVVNE
ncbi:hypothetical protein HMPREF3182_00225 [Megasphaera hutchinsoni]|uniref:DUF2325 domain-containing protein n=2 Tax=Megasphaera hutchinsoni TaxID=1588748 RepID=A0A134CKU3_9FIRM|nr:hypothetical protein HMPREF3182_00225 [Megasphaera hutchinsoni]